MRSWAFLGGVMVPLEGNCWDSSFRVLALQTPLWAICGWCCLSVCPFSLFVPSLCSSCLFVHLISINEHAGCSNQHVCKSTSWLSVPKSSSFGIYLDTIRVFFLSFFCLLFKPVDTDFYCGYICAVACSLPKNSSSTQYLSSLAPGDVSVYYYLDTICGACHFISSFCFDYYLNLLWVYIFL